MLGDSKRVAADHYVYALTDYREIDRSIARSPAPAEIAETGPPACLVRVGAPTDAPTEREKTAISRAVRFLPGP
jgi:hypothetical protein